MNKRTFAIVALLLLLSLPVLAQTTDTNVALLGAINDLSARVSAVGKILAQVRQFAEVLFLCALILIVFVGIKLRRGD